MLPTAIFEDDELRIIAARDRARRLECSPTSRAEVRGAMVFAHGMAEHPARHVTLARSLVRLGMRVILPCLDGHAFGDLPLEVLQDAVRAYATSDSPSDVADALRPLATASVAAEIPRLRDELASFDAMAQVERILEACRDARTQLSPRAPLLLGGLSLGGLLALAAAQQAARDRSVTIAGLLLINPALAPAGPPMKPLQNWIVRFLWQLRVAGVPVLAVQEAAAALAGEVDVRWVRDWISDLPEERALQAMDPFIHRSLPARFLLSVQELMFAVHRRTEPIATTCLVCLADRDRIVDPNGARQFVDRHASRSASSSSSSSSGRAMVECVRVEDQFSHELLRSSDGSTVVRHILKWCADRLGLAA